MKSYNHEYICEPIYTISGRLVAIEILTSFTTLNGAKVSYKDVKPKLTPEYRWTNFARQLYYIKRNEAWFHYNNIKASLNIDECTAIHLINSKNTLHMVCSLPFINLEVHEDFPSQENHGQNIISELHKWIPIWLDDVGSGSTNNFDLLKKGYFNAAKIDKDFFWRNYNSKTKLLDKVIIALSKHTDQVVIEGIETLAHINSLLPYPHCWLQGYLFPRQNIRKIKKIPVNLNFTDLIKTIKNISEGNRNI